MISTLIAITLHYAAGAFRHFCAATFHLPWLIEAAIMRACRQRRAAAAILSAARDFSRRDAGAELERACANDLQDAHRRSSADYSHADAVY